MSWTNYGLGKHITRVSPPDLEKGLLTLWIVLWLYFTGLWLSKLSAIAFYARIFGLGNKNKKYRAALWVVVGLLNVWMIGLILSLLLQCRPLHKSWERKIPGECYDYYLWWLSSTLSNFLLDMIVLLLPLPMLWRLQIDRSKKKYIYCVFITGYS